MLFVESDATLEAVAALEGDALVDHITEAIERYLRAQANQAPMVIVFDDLHWADSASLDLLLNVAELAGKLPSGRLPATADKDAPSWSAIKRARSDWALSLPRSCSSPRRRTCARVARQLALHRRPSGERAQFDLDKAEGNPFFVEEVIRSLIDSDYIVQENAHRRAIREREC